MHGIYRQSVNIRFGLLCFDLSKGRNSLTSQSRFFFFFFYAILSFTNTAFAR